MRKKSETNTRFCELLEKYELTRPEAARILDVALRTIDSWKGYPQRTSSNKMPKHMLELFELKLNVYLAQKQK